MPNEGQAMVPAGTACGKSHLNSRNLKGLGLAAGIFVSLMVYGLLQESLMTSLWPSMGGKQVSSVFLVMCNRIATLLVAVIAILLHREQFSPQAPIASFLVISFSNIIATTCQYEALRYVSFPTQTLGKTAKMIPVMIWGSLLSQKKYTFKDYIVVGSVTVGTTLFLLTGPVNAKGKEPKDMSMTLIGMGIMVLYLLFDGFTSTWQERLFKDVRVSTWNQMLYVGLLSTIVTGIGSVSAPVPPFDPKMYSYLFALSMSAAVAQIFILQTIKEFGALLFAAVMTTRQFLSILLSCIIFLHPLMLGQWAGTVLVFGALYYKTFAGGKHNGNSAYPKEPPLEEGKEMIERQEAIHSQPELGPSELSK